MADKEQEIRTDAGKQLAFIQREASVKLEGWHELTVASGRVDSVYTRVLIEYQNPSSPPTASGRGKSSITTRKGVYYVSMFKDDPLIKDWKKSMADHRRMIDRHPERP